MGAAAEKLVLVRTFNAPIERVYAAWTDAEQMKRWFAPGDMSVPQAEADVREGGRYRVQMQETGSDGAFHTTGGVYREVVPNERLVFTWKWEGSELETLVTLNFKALSANETELTLTHEGFDNEDTRKKHAQGWGGCLANLESFLA